MTPSLHAETPTGRAEATKIRRRCWAVASTVLLCLAAGFSSGKPASAQALKVMPVNIQLLPGQKTATLTVINEGSGTTSIQFRTYAWNQPKGIDQLTPSPLMLLSPPIATLAPGATQIVRIVLKGPKPVGEETYRLVLDQIPPPAEEGVVHVVLRMSIPIFIQSKAAPLSHLQFHLERSATHVYLVGVNDGNIHQVIHDVELSTSEGLKLQTSCNGSQYLLAGVTRRWDVTAQDALPTTVASLRLKAASGAGSFEQQVNVVEIP